MQKRLEWLDLFRGLAAAAVVFTHFHWAFHLPDIHFGGRAVDLFFVLSGIVLGRRYEARFASGMTMWQFAWHRARRLYPALALTVLLIVAMNLAGLPDTHWTNSTAGTVLALGLMLPYSPTYGSGPMFPADISVWSLWAEVVANGLWFAALLVGARFARGAFLACMVGYVLIKFNVGHLGLSVDESGYLNLAGAVVRAMAGFGIGYAISVRAIKPFAPTWLALLAFIATCVMSQRATVNQNLADLFVVLTGALLLLNLAHQEGPRSRAVAWVCRWAGLISYPLYLLHIPASRLATWIAAHGVRTSIAYAGTFLLLSVGAVLASEWVIRQIPADPPRRSQAAAA